jgi:hypothetical protein
MKKHLDNFCSIEKWEISSQNTSQFHHHQPINAPSAGAQAL